LEESWLASVLHFLKDSERYDYGTKLITEIHNTLTHSLIIHSLLLERQPPAVTISKEPGLGPLSTLLELVGLHQLLEVLFIESESGGVLS
jgi:hypothetical protein